MRTLAPLIALFLMGCGASAPKTETPDAPSTADAPPAEKAPEAAEEPKAEEDSKKIPETCAGESKEPCLMPKGFVKRLCGGAYPELALMFFHKESPWKRAYVAVKEASPFNAFNGPSSDEKLTFDEELLVLSEKKADTGGMQVSGAGSSYDLLRWDGTCVTLTAEEVRFNVPPKPKHAIIPWRVLEDGTQEALKGDEGLGKIAAERKKECKGATMGPVTDKCEKADKKLNDMVVDVVRRGNVKVPQPSKIP